LSLQTQTSPLSLLNFSAANNLATGHQGLLLGNTSEQAELSTIKGVNKLSTNIFNNTKFYRYKDLKSPNQQFLSPDKNPRKTASLGLTNPSTYPLMALSDTTLPTNLTYPTHNTSNLYAESSLG
jgi:hypothetical protein